MRPIEIKGRKTKLGLIFILSLALVSQVHASPICSRAFDLEISQNSSLSLEQLSLPDFKSDSLNTNYFLALLSKYRNKSAGGAIKLYEPGVDISAQNVVYPTASAPEQMMKHFPVQSYQAIREKQRSDVLFHAKSADLYIAKMQAGTGSSIVRNNYLARTKGIDLDKVRIGAKGTDLLIPNSSHKNEISIAEAQILQATKSDEGNDYGTIHWIDLMSPETETSIQNIWKNLDPKDARKIKRETPIMQYNVPTLNTDGQPTLNRMAPAGHGLFAFSALKTVLSEKNPKNKILVISNGEDLSGSPDPYIVGYMKKNKIPILMITTDKTEIDLKGGQIAVATEIKNGKAIPFVTIVEHAQADAAQQKKLFESLGLRDGDRKAAFNTNMVLINYEALAPLLKAEVAKVGEEKFFDEIGPSLIENWKTQKDKDGVERKYLQLEGAMGSMILNLDRYFRINTGKPVVGFVNIERNFRTQFFAPIKTAFDYYMQFYSDRFSYDAKTHKLVDHRPGMLPSVKLIDEPTKDKYYADVDNVIATFTGSSIRDVDQIVIEGRMQLNNVVLIGNVQITNKTQDNINLEKYLDSNPTLAKKVKGKWVLDNQKIIIE